MTDRVPTRVVMYSILAGEPGEPTPIAEFRWSPESGVTLIELDQRWARAARNIYENGADSYSEERMVPRTEGPAFMRTLIQPTRTTYYGFSDKSDDA